MPLCRAPTPSNDRLEEHPDGGLLLRLKTRWRDGTTHVLMEQSALIDRLVPLIPPPRAHQVRYHGILAPCASLRSRVVPSGGVGFEICAPAAEATPESGARAAADQAPRESERDSPREDRSVDPACFTYAHRRLVIALLAGLAGSCFVLLRLEVGARLLAIGGHRRKLQRMV